MTKREAKPKVGILSLGCARNLVDSEGILGRLNLKGHPIVDIDKADIGILNTCAFIKEAKTESIDAILDLADLKKQGKLKKIIVYGCLSQRYGEVLARRLPQVDAFVGRVSLNHDARAFSITPRHYAYLKICEGCINSCSYCIIPKIKGGFTSLNMGSVLKRLKCIQEAGASEVNIIGQDITGYGTDLYGAPKLTQLLKRMLKEAKDIGWFRLLYLYPSRITGELIDLIKDEPRICKYIDLPLQHINSRILKLMGRHSGKKEIFDLISKIRKKIPQVGLRTSLIVGFPSETDKEFSELCNFVEEFRFERLGAFIYSREEGTRAFDFKAQLPQKVKAGRLDRIMSLQRGISEEINKKFLGRTLDVLIDQKEGSSYLGRTQHDAPEVDGLVYVSSDKPLAIGSFVKVLVSDTLEYDLSGRAQ